MKQQSNSHIACRVYAKAAPHLLELPADDPARLDWMRHTRSCADCRGLLEADAKLVARFVHLPVPEPAYVRSRVMSNLKAKSQPSAFRRRDFAWGVGSAFVGIAVGLLIAAVNFSGNSPISVVADQEDYADVNSDSFDQLVSALTSESGERR